MFHGDKIRIGCLNPAFWGTRKWAEMLRQPCFLRDTQQRRQKQSTWSGTFQPISREEGGGGGGGSRRKGSSAGEPPVGGGKTFSKISQAKKIAPFGMACTGNASKGRECASFPCMLSRARVLKVVPCRHRRTNAPRWFSKSSLSDMPQACHMPNTT